MGATRLPRRSLPLSPDQTGPHQINGSKPTRTVRVIVSNSSDHLLLSALESQLGLPGATPSPGDSAGQAEAGASGDTAPDPVAASLGTPETAAQPDEITLRLATSLANLRVHTALPPRPDSVLRLFERVAEQQAQDEASQSGEHPAVGGQAPDLTELLDYCTGQLDDPAAGAIERRLAQHPDAQGRMLETAKLAGILEELRVATERPAPRDGLARFLDRVNDSLDEALVVGPDGSVERATALPKLATSERSTNRGTRRSAWSVGSRLVLAASLLIGLALVVLPVVSPSATQSVFVQVERATTIEALHSQAEPLTKLVGEELLRLDQVDPVELADLQLLADLAASGRDATDLELAHRLARRDSGLLAQAASDGQLSAHGALPWENTAFADGDTARHQRAVREAIRAGQYREVERLAASSWRAEDRLLQVWALEADGQTEAARRFLHEVLDSEAVEQLPLAGRVYLAGAARSLGLLSESAEQFLPLVAEVPGLNFHLGTLFLRRLHNESRARQAFEALGTEPRLADRRDFGLALVPATIALADRSDIVLRLREALSPLTAEDRVFGQSNWSNYQITVDVHTATEATWGREPTLAIVGLRASESDQVRAAISLDRASIERREPVGAEAFVSKRLAEARLPEPLQANQWYRVKLRFESSADGLWTGLKIWPSDGQEPAGWLVERLEASQDHTSGAMGLAASDLPAAFANLRVERFEPAR